MDAVKRFWDDPTQLDALLEELGAERQRILAESTE